MNIIFLHEFEWEEKRNNIVFNFIIVLKIYGSVKVSKSPSEELLFIKNSNTSFIGGNGTYKI
jgi:hypothetical protein